MKRYRSATLALVTCAAALSLAACSAGVTQATPATSTTAVSKPASSPTPSHTASPAAAGGTVSLGGSLGNFPLPPGAKVLENATYGNKITLILSSVPPAQVSSFYTSALPHAGYKITSNSSAVIGNSTDAGIEFTGHGYKGLLGAISSVPSSSGASPSGGAVVKNLTGITFTRS
jgi:hypothetical protein